MKNSKYKIEKIDFNDNETRDQSLALLKRTFENSLIFTEQWWAWKYLNSYFGTALGWCAKDSITDEIVGLRILWPWKFYGNGKTILSYQMIDSATDRRFQGQGIFSKLTSTALEAIGDTLIFNFPNQNSAPLSLKLGWKELKNQPWLLSLSKFCLLKGQWQIGNMITSSSIFSKVEHNDNDEFFSTHWSQEALEWRFKNHPYITYYYFSTVKSLIIYRIEVIKNIRIATIMFAYEVDMHEIDQFSKAMFLEKIFFFRYNAFNDVLYENIKSKLFTFSISKRFRYFTKNNLPIGIKLTTGDTDFL